MSGFYESNNKQTYGRGWAVNRILERLPVHPSQATVLYLAGEGHDHALLLKRGFCNENIVAVDIDAVCVQRVRDEGGLAIEGSIAEVMMAWPDDWPIHAVLADYNCGFDRHVHQFIMALFAPAMHKRAVVYVNMMRGRDELGRGQLSKEIAARQLALYGRQCKSRAVAFLGILLGEIAKALFGVQPSALTGVLFVASEAWPKKKPVLATPYRQRDGGVLMDGVVFVRPDFDIRSGVREGEFSGQDWWVPLRRKLAALRAVRTRMARAA